MSENKKGVMMCGMDENKYARAVSVDENGVIQMPFSCVTDDNNKQVLRVVDAAPYLVEYGVVSSLITQSKTISTGYTKILDENSDRKFASLYNNSSDPMTVTPAASGIGIIVKAGERYDMSAMNGNLYQGEMYASMLGNTETQITSFSQGGIQADGSFSSSAKRTHTDYIGVTVPSDGLEVTVSINSGTSATIRNVCCYDTNHAGTYYDPDSQSNIFPVSDGDRQSATFTLNNTGIKFIVVSFASKTDATADYSVSDMTGVVLTVTVGTDHQLIVTEGE